MALSLKQNSVGWKQARAGVSCSALPIISILILKKKTGKRIKLKRTRCIKEFFQREIEA